MKYYNPSIVRNKLLAMERFFDEILVKMTKDQKGDGYQFRRNHIYQLGVAHCLDLNEDGLFKVFEKYRMATFPRKYFNKDSIEKMISDCKLNINKKELLF